MPKDKQAILVLEQHEEDGVEWDCQKDRKHYWRLLEFSKLHQFDNLTDHCYLKLYSVQRHAFQTWNPCVRENYRQLEMV